MTCDGFFVIRRRQDRRTSKEGRSIDEYLGSEMKTNSFSRFEDQIVSPSSGIVGEVAMEGREKFVQKLVWRSAMI